MTYFDYVFANPQRTKAYVGHGDVDPIYNRIDESLEEQRLITPNLDLIIKIECYSKESSKHLELETVKRLLNSGWILYQNPWTSGNNKILQNKVMPTISRLTLSSKEQADVLANSVIMVMILADEQLI